MRIFNSPAQRRRHYRRFRIRIYFLASFVLLLGILSLFTILKLPTFQIKKFEISGPITFGEARGKIFSNFFTKILGHTNFFSWPEEIGKIKIEKDYLAGVLKITSPELERFAIWCGDSCFWIDSVGVAIEPAPDTEGSAIFKIQSNQQESIAIGKSVISETVFAVISEILTGLKNTPVAIEEISLDAKLQELIILTAKKTKLFFSYRFIPSTQVFEYISEIAQSGKLAKLKYVDFTVEHRIYEK